MSGFISVRDKYIKVVEGDEEKKKDTKMAKVKIELKARGNIKGLAKHLAKKYGPSDEGFFTRCMAAEELSDYPHDTRAAICAKAHKVQIGTWPGEKKKKMAKVKMTLKGGPGSGHHGHAGRSGEVGGSAPGKGKGGKGKGGDGKDYGKPVMDQGWADELGDGEYQVTVQTTGNKPTKDEAASFVFDTLMTVAEEEIVSEEGPSMDDIELSIKRMNDEYGEPYEDAWQIEAIVHAAQSDKKQMTGTLHLKGGSDQD